MLNKNLLQLFPLLFLPYLIQAQTPFPPNGEVFIDDLIPKIEIFIQQQYLETILAPENATSDIHYPATFIFNNGNIKDTVEHIGFRLRGNTSRYSKKKSFKISFNTFEQGRKYYGFEKLNINGEHNDPSVIRSKVCWDLLRDMKIPAPRANHVELYVNNEYFGLYINVEHIDENFVRNRFGNNDGNLYKCTWPADLAYRGTNPDNYKQLSGDERVYELTTNKDADDYTDLAQFINVINNTPIADLPCQLEKVLNVDGMIRAIAFDILSGNWDGPHYNKNNFYLYKNSFTGKFEYIPYDLDNTLGIDWLNRDWGLRNIYNWAKNDEPRPLYKNILLVPEYKNRLSYYLDYFIENYFVETRLFPYLDAFRTKISNAAAADPFRPLDYGFSMTDFFNSYNIALQPWHVQYGLKPYITTRRNSALDQLQLQNISPIINDVYTNFNVRNNEFFINARVFDDVSMHQVQFCYSYTGTNFSCFNMEDNGQYPDQYPGDSLFSYLLTMDPDEENLHYYILAKDNTGKTYSYPFCEHISLQIAGNLSNLFINEFMAENNNTITDEAGDYDDWVELFNGGDEPVFLGGLYMTDKHSNPGKWPLPDIWMEAGEFLLFWADDETDEGPLHMSFKLSKEGELVGLFKKNNDESFILVDSIHFGIQKKDISYGRITDGAPNWDFMQPTPGYSNNTVSTYSPGFSTLNIFPNPADNRVLFTFENTGKSETHLEIIDMHGRLQFVKKDGFTAGLNRHEIPVNHLPVGIYMVKIHTGEQTFTGKMVINR